MGSDERSGAESHLIGFGGFRFLAAEAARIDQKTLPISTATTTEGSCFGVGNSELCFSPGAGSFQLIVTNGTDSDIVFDFREGKYLDETRRPHEIYGYPDARGWQSESLRSPQPIVVPPKQRTVFRVAPVEKAYYVRETEEEHNLIHEVMVPWNVRDRSREEVREDQRRIIADGTTVSLALPITIEGVRRSIEVDFVLKDP